MSKKLDLRIDLSKVKKIPVDFHTPEEVDDEVLIEEYINERKLRQATGEEDLSKVRYLEIVVNTSKCSLGSIGKMLPSLKQLKLNGSNLNTIRDIGTSVMKLEVLWMSRCSLKEFDGVSIYSNLTELYASYNQISDLFPISFLSSLEIIDLEGNSISSTNQIYNLADLPKLSAVNLSNNPISLTDRNEYLSKVKSILPDLELLDDYEINHVQNQHKKPLISKKKEREYKRQKELLANEISFMKNSIRFTNIDENKKLELNPRIICKAPEYLSIEEREVYMRRMEKRPMTARARFRGGDKRGKFGLRRFTQEANGRIEKAAYSCSSFNQRPMTARPNKEYFYEENLHKKEMKKKKKKKKEEIEEENSFKLQKESINRDFKQFKEDIQKREVRMEPISDDYILQEILKNKFEKKKREDAEQMNFRDALVIKRKKKFQIEEEPILQHIFSDEIQPSPKSSLTSSSKTSFSRSRRGEVRRKNSKKKSSSKKTRVPKIKKLRNPKKMVVPGHQGKKLKPLKKKRDGRQRNKENNIGSFSLLNQSL